MRVALFTFSGTGNTHYAASMLVRSFERLGAEVKSFNIEKVMYNNELLELLDADIIGIGYPVHAFNAPKIVVDFAKSFAKSKGQKVFIYKTAGEPFYWNDSSSVLLMKHLKRKGYELVFERHLLMLYNILTRYPDTLVKQMVTVTEKLCFDMQKEYLTVRSVCRNSP